MDYGHISLVNRDFWSIYWDAICCGWLRIWREDHNNMSRRTTKLNNDTKHCQREAKQSINHYETKRMSQSPPERHFCNKKQPS